MEMIAYARKGMQVNICLLRLQSQEMGCSDVTSGLPGVHKVFRILTSCQWDSRDLGRHNFGLYSTL